MKVFLIRHAKTIDAENQLSQRDSTEIVTDKDTLAKIEKLKKRFSDVDAVYCSPINRTQQTVKLLFGEENYQTLDYLYEYKTPSEIVGKERSVAIDFWEVINKTNKYDVDWSPQGGESVNDILKRVDKFYKFLLNQKGKHSEVVVVGHGTFFRYFLLHSAKVPVLEYPQLIFDVLRKLSWNNLQVVEVEI